MSSRPTFPIHTGPPSPSVLATKADEVYCTQAASRAWAQASERGQEGGGRVGVASIAPGSRCGPRNESDTAQPPPPCGTRPTPGTRRSCRTSCLPASPGHGDPSRKSSPGLGAPAVATLGLCRRLFHRLCRRLCHRLFVRQIQTATQNPCVDNKPSQRTPTHIQPCSLSNAS